MPAYFFHLAFELHNRATNQYALQQNFNIFEDYLPSHCSSSWASYIAPRKESSRQNNRAKNTNTDSHLSRHSRQAHLDWRAEEITVEQVEMEMIPEEKIQSLESQSLAKENTKQLTAAALATRGKYVPSNPRSTDLGYGVVHLYRDKEPATILDFGNVSQPAISATDVDADQAYVDNDCTTLCILAVPTYMTPSDLLGWVGEETREHVSHFRLIRSGRANKYMVLMKFRKAEKARQWQKTWNGKLFNSMEPENCHIVFVKSIQFQSTDDRKDPSSFPDMSNDPFTPILKKPATQSMNADSTSASAEQQAKPASTLSTKPAPPVLELPTCPVCLERMDETTGLATIFCQHVFHCACLQKWRGGGCPVCRYTQDELPKAGSTCCAQNECNTCGATENLWICLICGHIGCGRYDEAHAFAHFEHTNHSFAMDISTQHIWDYVGDEWVHRLIQNKADGKLVELPGSAKNGKTLQDADCPVDKVESMSQEYTQLLQSQLDSQRTYFEEQVERAVNKASAASAAAEQAADQAVKAWSRLEALEASNTAVTRDTIPSLERDKDRAERKAQKLESTTRQLQHEWNESKVINESLMDRIAHLEKQLEEANLKSSELEEQNRDLSFFISGMEKLKDQGEEVQQGTVSVPEPPASGKKKKKKGGQKSVG